PFPLCCSVVVTDEDGQETLVEDVSIAHGNVALVDHGSTIASEALPAPIEGRRYRPPLREPEVTQAVRFDREAWRLVPPGEAGGTTAAAALRQDPREALPAV